MTALLVREASWQRWAQCIGGVAPAKTQTNHDSVFWGSKYLSENIAENTIEPCYRHPQSWGGLSASLCDGATCGDAIS